LNMLNNDVTVGAASGQEDYRLQVRGVNTFQLQDFVGSGSNATDITNWITTTKHNTKFDGTSTPTTQISLTSGGVFSASAGAIPTPVLPTPLLAASGGVESSSGSPGETLTQTTLNSVVQSALDHWTAAGLSAAQLAVLQHLTYNVTDIEAGWLGASTPGHVTIDVDADGHGWFIDPTPADNTEFAHAASATHLTTDPTEAPAGHMDLLTTVMHEMGEQLGLDDSFASADSDDLMYGYLTTGERRLPDVSDVVRAQQGDTAETAQAAEAALPPGAAAPAGTLILAGAAGNDTLIAGPGGVILAGGGGADTFVFDQTPQPTASAPAAPAHIADYSALQGDSIDVSALLTLTQAPADPAAPPAPPGLKPSDAMLVQAQEDASGTFAILRVNTDGGYGDWVEIAQLDGVHAGDAINVVLDPTHAVHQIHADWLV
jgi:hypothetical protein